MIQPWFWLPARISHALSGVGVEAAACLTSSPRNIKNFQWRDFQWRNVHFRNPLGIAGGLDKNAEHMLSWQKLWAGFLEI